MKPYFGPCTLQAHSAVHTQEYSYESAKRHYLSRMRRGAVRGSAQLSSLKSAHELPPPTVHGVVQVRVILWSPTAGRYEKRNVTAIFCSGGLAQTGSKSYPKPQVHTQIRPWEKLISRSHLPPGPRNPLNFALPSPA